MLIAVAIVGVIAAIVLPMVVTNYQKNMLNHQYKREVQSINNAVNDLSIGENKTTFFSTMMYYDSEPSSYEENAGLFLKKYFKVALYCGENNGNCFAPAYYTYKDNMRKVYTPEYKGACAQLKNGMSICITPQVGNLGVHGLLDLNGKKGPNVWGEDLRDFIIDPLERSAINRETSEVYYEDYLVPSNDSGSGGSSNPSTPPTPSNPCSVNPSSLDCCKTKKITSPTDKCCTYTEIKDNTPACIDTSISITLTCKPGKSWALASKTVSYCEYSAKGYEAETYLMFIPVMDGTKRKDNAFSCAVSGITGSKAPCCGLNDFRGYATKTCRDPGDMSMDKRVFSYSSEFPNDVGPTNSFCSRKAELWQNNNGIYTKITEFSDTVSGATYYSKYGNVIK